MVPIQAGLLTSQRQIWFTRHIFVLQQRTARLASFPLLPPLAPIQNAMEGRVCVCVHVCAYLIHGLGLLQLLPHVLYFLFQGLHHIAPG